MRIANAIALVTGANRGIGASLVRELTDRGARRVYAAARGQDGVSLPAAQAPPGDVVVPVRMDVTDPGQVAEVAAAATDVTLLINNAGIMTRGSVLHADLDQVERELAVNYLGPLRTARAFVPLIEANGGGAIVNMITVLALAPWPSFAAYCAAKAAADSATRSLRAEVASRRIAVHAVYPAFVDTDMIAGLDAAEKADPDDVARAILDAIEQGTGDVTPGQVATDLWQAWIANARSLDDLFAAG